MGKRYWEEKWYYKCKICGGLRIINYGEQGPRECLDDACRGGLEAISKKEFDERCLEERSTT